MVVLKKIKGSTLMETLVATVLIVIVFMIASATLNNIFSNSIKNNIEDVDAVITELAYQCKNDKIKTPFETNYKHWYIRIEKKLENNNFVYVIEAIDINSSKSLNKSVYADF